LARYPAFSHSTNARSRSRQRVFGNDGEAFAGVLVGVPVVGVTGELGAGKGADEVGTEGGVVVELEVVGTVAAVVVVDGSGVVDGGTLKGVPSGVVVVVDGCVVEFSGSVVDVDGITSHCSGRLTAGTPVSDGHGFAGCDGRPVVQRHRLVLRVGELPHAVDTVRVDVPAGGEPGEGCAATGEESDGEGAEGDAEDDECAFHGGVLPVVGDQSPGSLASLCQGGG
jgi:hypothetical protein